MPLGSSTEPLPSSCALRRSRDFFAFFANFIVPRIARELALSLSAASALASDAAACAVFTGGAVAAGSFRRRLERALRRSLSGMTAPATDPSLDSATLVLRRSVLKDTCDTCDPSRSARGSS